MINANYNQKTDYMEITPYELVYMNKGKKVVKKHNITYEDIVEQLKKIKYQEFYDSIGGKDAYNTKLEHSKMPSICRLYYSLFVKDARIPDCQYLVDEYVHRYCYQLQSGKYVIKDKYKEYDYYLDFTYEDVAGRVLRAYNSFNREIALLTYLFKYKDKFKIRYSYYEDYVDGVDICVRTKDKKFGLATYVSSRNSNRHRQHKKDCFYKKSKFIMFDLPARISINTKSVGDVEIYSEEYIDEVIEKILSYS